MKIATPGISLMCILVFYVFANKNNLLDSNLHDLSILSCQYTFTCKQGALEGILHELETHYVAICS